MRTNRSSSALGDFIKSRRERLQPSEAGIQPLPGRRRTPGLRREEVSYLANMSVTLYSEIGWKHTRIRKLANWLA
ncbi:hypothetical protein GCM10023310_63040 [Paenibacillus vulneris]